MHSHPQRTILVVDNFSNNRTIIRSLLLNMGYPNVHVAADGDAAWNCLNLYRKNHQYDLVVTDVTLTGGMSGLKLLETIKASNAHKHIPVMVVTAEASKEIVMEAAKLGATGYILKPFKPVDFMKRVAKIMEQQYQIAA